MAETKLKIPHILDPEDVAVAGEDSIMTLLTEYYHLFTRCELDQDADKTKPHPPLNIEELKVENEKLVLEKNIYEQQLKDLTQKLKEKEKETEHFKEQAEKQLAKKKLLKNHFFLTKKEADSLLAKNSELENQLKELKNKLAEEAPSQVRNCLIKLLQIVSRYYQRSSRRTYESEKGTCQLATHYCQNEERQKTKTASLKQHIKVLLIRNNHIVGGKTN